MWYFVYLKNSERDKIMRFGILYSIKNSFQSGCAYWKSFVYVSNAEHVERECNKAGKLRKTCP